jgi:hypothetical protein
MSRIRNTVYKPSFKLLLLGGGGGGGLGLVEVAVNNKEKKY